MRVSEKAILATLALLLLSLSTVAQTSILETRAYASTSWQAEIGFYLPFVLFALVSTYHFLDWARKHRRKAMIMITLIVIAASLLGLGSAGAPRPVSNPLTIQLTTTQQTGVTGGQITQPRPSLEENLIKLREVLSSTPYFSAGFDALAIIASGIAVLVLLVRLRRDKPIHPIKSTVRPTDLQIRGGTPREIVIQSYKLASLSLQNSGLEIPESDTPWDAFARMKEFKPTIADAFLRLTLLFEEAKFSLHSITEYQANEASLCFKSITNL